MQDIHIYILNLQKKTKEKTFTYIYKKNKILHTNNNTRHTYL